MRGMGGDGAFPLVGEPLAVDLVNTRTGVGAGVDLLDSTEALDAWLKAQQPRVEWVGPAGVADLEAVRGLRDDVATLLRVHREGRVADPAAVRGVNRAAAAAPSHLALSWPAGEPARGERVRSGPPPARVLAAVAESAVGLLTGPDAGRLRTCEHPDCVLVFVAANARRRWCSAARCGNRARVARHYRRHHSAS